MATIAQEKRPAEIIELDADFVNTLLTGESVIGANVSVVIHDILTDADVTSSILFGVPTVTGSVVSFKVQGGEDGDCFTITIKTGQTTGGNAYETTANLVITLFPATENPLTTRDEVKRQLKIDDNSDDRLLDDLIISASAYIRNRCKRQFHISTFTEIIRIPQEADPTRVKLANYPVLQVDRIQTVNYVGQVIYDLNLASDTYESVPEGYVWWTNFSYTFFIDPDWNVITYRAGYKKIPEDIRQACKELVVSFYRAIGREGLSSEKIGDYSYDKSLISSWPDALRREIDVPFVEGVIRRYMKHDFDYESAF